MAGPTYRIPGDPDEIWIPVPGAIARRTADGKLGLWDETAGAWVLLDDLGGGGGGGVSSFQGRSGDVLAEMGDYADGLVPATTYPGAASVADALASLHVRVEALEMAPPPP